MARYQLRRPSPVTVFPRRVRRQNPTTSTVAAPEEEEEGPESPDSPSSSPSTVGASSESEDSDSDDDEPPSPAGNSTLPAASQASASGGSMPISLPASSATNRPSATLSASTTLQVSSIPGSSKLTSAASAASAVVSRTSSANAAFTASFSSQGNLAAVPQVTDTASFTTTTRPATTSKVEQSFSSRLARPENSQITSASIAPAIPVQSESAGQTESPQKSSPSHEKTLITKGGAAAAITLSVIGALAIVIAAAVFYKRRKRLQNKYNQRLADDAFDPSNTGSLHAPETAHVSTASPFFAGGNGGGGGGGGGGGSHLTRSTDRSDSLFGAGPYTRPETVSTDRNRSRFPIAPPQPTPNPFADPPLNKAYDVLAGRPRSTTLTDRGSWVKNPFKDPGSERFDPFGEMQEKARRERKRWLEESRKEAEAARQKQVEEKEKMGLEVPRGRKGSGVTIEGVGVLDRSGGGGGFR